ncbi:MAG TPA: protein translocase subunit SecD [Acidimicrobiales bacterium]|nr:protein translocase subunit SecD [Acidimicrobiales bacterium]
MRKGLVVALVGIIFAAAGGLAATVAAGNSPELGLDLQGGASVVLRPKRAVATGVLNQSIEIIRNRVDALGVSEPDISRQGSNIIVQLPGVKNRDRALQIVGQTAELRFRPVLGVLPPEDAPPTTTTTTTTKPGETTTTVAGTPTTPAPDPNATTTVAPAPTTPPDPNAPTTTAAPTTTTTIAQGIKTTTREEDKADVPVILPKITNGDVTERYSLGPAELTGRALKSARAEFDPQQGWLVNFTLTSKASKDFDALAAKNLNKQVAIVLDGVVKTAPTINEASFGGSGQISGDFSEREAKDLALVLRYGSLPVELEPETVQTVSASLGKESLKAGLTAGFVGLGLVLLYIVLYYRALGLVVIMGLTVWAALLWSIISLLGATSGLALSLSGAVGIIVSVGVTVDSYIVYFERLKDEIRAGKTIRSSVDRGFSRAFRTILAADVASFIGAALLYLLTVGSVRGFAFFLGLSTLLDVVVAYFFTRPMVVLLGRNRVFTSARWLGVARGLAAPPPVVPARSGATP